jgi:hypothetical protein
VAPFDITIGKCAAIHFASFRGRISQNLDASSLVTVFRRDLI